MGRRELPGAGFTPADPDLADHVLLDWDAFEEWREEEEVVVGHPHDPFDRIDCRRSSRHVVISFDGTVLADTRRAVLLMETPLPLRFYVPAEDVDQRPARAVADTHRVRLQGHRDVLVGPRRGRVLPDLAWTYRDPLHDALPVRDLLGFFTERVDLSVDGRVRSAARDALVVRSRGAVRSRRSRHRSRSRPSRRPSRRRRRPRVRHRVPAAVTAGVATRVTAGVSARVTGVESVDRGAVPAAGEEACPSRKPGSRPLAA